MTTGFPIDDDSIEIFLPRMYYGAIRNLAEDYIRVIDSTKYNNLPFSFKYSKEFPVRVSLDEHGYDEYLNKKSMTFDLSYATEVAEDISESVILYTDIYVSQDSESLLKQNEKKEKNTHLDFSKEPSAHYSLRLRACDVDRKIEDGKYVAYGWIVESTQLKPVDKDIIQKYEDIRKQEEQEKIDAKAFAIAQGKRAKEREIKEKEEEEKRKKQDKKDKKFLSDYSLDKLLTHESSLESINELRELASQPKVLLYTSLVNSEVFYDQKGEFISLVYDNDAMFRDEYHGGLFSHFGIEVSGFSLPRLLDKKIDVLGEDGEDMNTILEKYLTPYVEKVLSKK